ncbi:MAG: pantetheine-phosphate adenylyltransferase [Syntrophobacteraceae bacterium]|nr:pantetheine-phosphate adenylyltransferase [Desulfobacteraceae bacterium]
MEKLAVYPGSFDPITNGHLDLLERGLKIFDRMVISVAANPGKSSLFSLTERIELIKASIEATEYRNRVEVDSFNGLLVDYVQKIGADAVVRGLRAVSDFEYEFMMALMNRKLNAEVETLFLMTGMRWIYISSRLIKEVVMSGGCVTGLVPEAVEKALIKRLGQGPGSTFR